MKIKTNLILLTLIFAIMAVVIGFVTFLTFDQINKELIYYNDINKMARDVSELSIITHEYFMHHEKRMHQQWLQKYDSIGRSLEKVKKKEVHPKHFSILKSVTLEYKIFGDLFSHLQTNLAKRKRLIEENKPQSEINTTIILEERVMAHALMRVQKIISGIFKFSAIMQKEVMELQERAVLIISFSITGFIVLSSCILFFVNRAITRPLNKLVKSTEIIGRGDLKHRVNIRIKNEFGELSVAFNQMTENLKKVTTSRDELNALNQQLQASEQQLRASNQQLRANEQQLRAEIAERKKAQEETKKHLYDMEVFYKASHGREERILELKKKIKELEKKLGKKPDNG